MRTNVSVFFSFLLGNALFATVLGTQYFKTLPSWPTDGFGASFLVGSLWSQLGLLTLMIGVLGLPFASVPLRWARWAWILIASMGLIILYVDTAVFSLYRFHLNLMVIEMVLSGQVVSFSWSIWLKVGSIVVGLLVIQYLLISWLSKRKVKKTPRFFWWYLISIFATTLYINGLHAWAAANAYTPVTLGVRYLPVFYPLTANSFMIKNGWANPEALAYKKQLKQKETSDLNYPLAPLVTDNPSQKLNIVWIVIDSWRYSDFSKEVMPHTWKFAQQGQQFPKHYSTGNATRAGVFGLFYGLPATYWHGFLANQRSPVLMDRLQELDYDIQAFGSSHLTSPEFDRTVFSQLPNIRLRSPDGSPSYRDEVITKEWINWFANRDADQPSFSFLFYDSAHGYDYPKDYAAPFATNGMSVDYLKLNNNTDPLPLHNKYKNSLHYIDSLLSRVYGVLQENDALKNTVIIITSDHGEEFNDNGLNYWGHNSNFTDVQIHIPLVWFDPEHANTAVEHWTTHEDIAPTILSRYLGVKNPKSDYSTGDDVFTPEYSKRKWILSAKYSGYAVIDDQKIIEVSTGNGNYQVYDKRNRLVQSAPETQSFQEAFERMRRFNR